MVAVKSSTEAQNTDDNGQEEEYGPFGHLIENANEQEDTTSTSEEEEIEGELHVTGTYVNEYGTRRVMLAGDTYEIMIDAGVKNQLDWDEAHHSWDDVREVWHVDADALDDIKNAVENASDAATVDVGLPGNTGVKTGERHVRYGYTKRGSKYNNETWRVELIVHDPDAASVIREMDWDLVHQKWKDARNAWVVDEYALDAVRDDLEAAGVETHF